MGSVTRVLNKTMPHTWIMGEKNSAQFDLAGQLTGAHDNLYKPADVQPIPTGDGTGQSTDTAALVEADRMRRLAKRASGLDSTIRTSPAGATLYSPQPKTLLGS